MKKSVVALILLVLCASSFSGTVGKPIERLELPELAGSYLICIFDKTANDWLYAHQEYDHSRAIRFEVPELGKWYWIGLWDENAGEYVYEKWVGHFPTTAE